MCFKNSDFFRKVIWYIDSIPPKGSRINLPSSTSVFQQRHVSTVTQGGINRRQMILWRSGPWFATQRSSNLFAAKWVTMFSFLSFWMSEGRARGRALVFTLSGGPKDPWGVPSHPSHFSSHPLPVASVEPWPGNDMLSSGADNSVRLNTPRF